MAVLVHILKQCRTCKYWKKTRPGQYEALCTNPNRYPVATRFDDGCEQHDSTVSDSVQQQSNTRG